MGEVQQFRRRATQDPKVSSPARARGSSVVPASCRSEPLEARRLMAAGPEFQVAPRNGPHDADASADGRTVVVFEGAVTQTHDFGGFDATFYTTEVFARVYDPAGAPVGPAFRVSDQQWRLDETLGSPRPFYNLDDADVAMADNGDFTVTWSKSMDPFDTGNAGAASTGLMMRRYTAAGAPRGAAVELSGAGTGDVAAAADGSFVVAESLSGFSRYDAAGRLLGQRELGDGNVFYPAVAMAPDGRFVVAWSEFPELGGPVVRAQRFDAAGQPLGASFVAGDHPELLDYYPAVAMNRSGEFAVSWGATWDTSDGIVKPGEGAYVRRFDAAGNPDGGAIHLVRPQSDNDIQSGTRTGGAAVVLDDGGNLTAVWNQGPGFLYDGFGGFESDIFARRFGPTGQPTGDTFRVNATTAGGHSRPHPAVDGAGRVTVFWDGIWMSQSNPMAVFGRRFTFDGTTTPPPATGTASVAGSLFDDADADGTRDAGEPALGGWRVFLDADKDGVFDSTEKGVLTDGAGNYRFTGLAAGTYRVREVVQSGWRRTSPTAGYFDVPVTSGDAAIGKSFGNTRRVLISGTSFSDADGDGVRDTGEAALASRRVFLDADADGAFDSTERSTLTDAAGNYRFGNLAAGTYRVREVLPAGWRRTAPPTGVHTLTLASGQSSTGRNFGSTQRVLISGTVFNDANGDRVRQSTEAGLAGWRVYLDADRDGVFDGAERSALTDSAGNYRFRDLVAGSYSVRVVQQSGWSRTTPTGGSYSVTLANGQTATNRLFGQRRIA